jgi:hypothetical protein
MVDGTPAVPPAGLKAAKTTPQLLEADNEALAEADPDAD